MIDPAHRAWTDNALRAWNAGDIGDLLTLYTEDVAFCSPLVRSAPHNASHWLQGTQEVAEHLLAIHSRFKAVDGHEILQGAGFFTLLMTHASGQSALIVEPDADQRARRVIVCHDRDVLRAISDRH